MDEMKTDGRGATAARGRLSARLRDAVERLPEPDRSVVLLHSFEGKSFRAVARELGMTEANAARCVFRRALQTVGRRLAP